MLFAGTANRQLRISYNCVEKPTIHYIYQVMKMVNKSVLTVFFVISAWVANAQMDNLFYAEKDVFDWEMVSKDSFGVYLKVPQAPDKTVYMVREKKLYKLFDENNKLVEEGHYDFVTDKSYGRVGQWTSYYINGQVNATGRYSANNPVGVWMKYFPDGKLMSISSYVLIEINSVKYYEMAGTYKEYYSNGKLKVDGLYKIYIDTAIQDAVLIENPKTGKAVVKTSRGEKPHTQQTGTWYYYKENGELLKTEEF